MKDGSIGLARVLVFASTLAVVGCSDSGTSSSGGSGGAGVAGAGGGSAGLASGGGSAGLGSGGGGSAGLAGAGGGAGLAGAGAGAGGGAGLGGGGSGGCAGVSNASTCTKEAGGTVVTSLCGDATLGSLTTSEANQLCSDSGDYFVASISTPSRCKFSALINAGSTSPPTEEQLRATCSTMETDCNADPSTTYVGANPTCGMIPAGCAATVAQYSTCIADEAALFDQGVGELGGCDMLTFGNLNEVYDVAESAKEAASCAELTTACPELFIPTIN